MVIWDITIIYGLQLYIIYTKVDIWGITNPQSLYPVLWGYPPGQKSPRFLTSDNHPQSSQKCSAIEKCKILLKIITTKKMFMILLFWVAHQKINPPFWLRLRTNGNSLAFRVATWRQRENATGCDCRTSKTWLRWCCLSLCGSHTQNSSGVNEFTLFQ